MACFDRWKAGYSLVDEEDVITDLSQIFDKYQLQSYLLTSMKLYVDFVFFLFAQFVKKKQSV